MRAVCEGCSVEICSFNELTQLVFDDTMKKQSCCTFLDCCMSTRFVCTSTYQGFVVFFPVVSDRAKVAGRPVMG